MERISCYQRPHRCCAHGIVNSMVSGPLIIYPIKTVLIVPSLTGVQLVWSVEMSC